MMICDICQKELIKEKRQRHHLIPRSVATPPTKGVVVTIRVHPLCHRIIHSVFTNKELKYKYNTLQDLQSSPAIKAYRKWLTEAKYKYLYTSCGFSSKNLPKQIRNVMVPSKNNKAHYLKLWCAKKLINLVDLILLVRCLRQKRKDSHPPFRYKRSIVKFICRITSIKRHDLKHLKYI